MKWIKSLFGDTSLLGESILGRPRGRIVESGPEA
jgi:hypothetical protein